MKQSENKILITGGATGIGYAMAERFIHMKNTVLICGRRSEALEEAAGKLQGLITRQCDLASAEQRIDLYNWIAAEHPDLTVLVNNAGIQNWMSMTDSDFYQRADEEITINIEAPVHLCSLFINLPTIKTIMNVTSGLAFVPLLKAPIYSATKAFFHSFTISMKSLLKPRGIEVIEIIPPALNTDLGGKGIHDFAPPVGDFIEAIFSQLQENKTTLTHSFTDRLSKAGQEVFDSAFASINRQG